MNARDRKYFESVIASSGLLNSDIATLDDNVGSSDSVGAAGAGREIDSSLHWGRAIQNVDQEITFEEVSSVCVVATIRRTIKGLLKIELPHDLGGKMKRTLIRKPFTEQSVRKAHFTRVANAHEPEEKWRLTAISLVKGGTGDDGVAIDELSLRFSSGDGLSLVAETDPVFNVGKGDSLTTATSGDVEIDLKVKLNTPEIEPNVVVFRSGTAGRGGEKSRLAFHSDTRSGHQFIHTYEDRVRVHPRPGVYYAIVEAFTRETLFDADAPVSTSFWGIPYVVH